jgi:formylglycine-generating enzyme required for sulfatase activity
MSVSGVLAACSLDFTGLTGGDAGRACPGTAGPSSVRVQTATSSFCIDATEVTNGDYQRFLDADAGGAQAAACAWNTSFAPSVWPGGDRLPVMGVDWCDAAAFCAWAGKHLCGRIGGGTLPMVGTNDPAASAWYAACSHGGQLDYPYGMTFQPTTCVDNVGQPAPVGAADGCIGGFPGLSDLSGNVEEWLDSCDGDTAGPDGARDACLAVGGAYFESNAARLSCRADAIQLQVRNIRESGRGFRCCSD